jgi:hypothetical protein
LKESSYDFYAGRQMKISNYNYARTILINLGFVCVAFTLIILGVIQIADSIDNTLVIALPICALLTLTCFLSVLLLNNKLRELRTKKRIRIRKGDARTSSLPLAQASRTAA